MAPGDSATARAAATARRLADPTTKLSKRSLGSMCTTLPFRRRADAGAAAGGGAGTGTQPLQHDFGNRTQRLEHAGPVERVRRKIGDASKVQRVGQLRRREDQVSRQVLLV